MTAALIAVETEDFAAAARTLDVELAEPLTRALNRLTNTLDASAAMAGDDAGGQEWAHSYDRAAAGALNAGRAAANAVTHLAVMFVQTARNYAAADAASDAGMRGRLDVALATVPCISDYQLPWCVPPSVAGGSGGPPHGWGFVEHLVGYVWPNGDPGRLRAAAGAWRGCAQVLSSGQCVVGAAVGRAVVDHIPEADDMTLVCSGLQNQLGETAALFDSMAAACDELARHIDDAHSAVEDELISLLEWSAGIEGVGALVSMFSFGAAEAPTQAVEAGRIAKTAANIAAIIERFLAGARALARAVLRLAEQADRLAAAQVGLTGLRLSDVVMTSVELAPSVLRVRHMLALRKLRALAGDFPEVVLTRAQAEAKFKHAAVFGVTASRGKAGFEAFSAAVKRFLDANGTTRVIGVYRGKSVILSYNIKNRLVVVQELDGTFVSAWKLKPKQLMHVVRDRRLGGA